MAFKGVDHVVIRVKDLDQAVDAYRKILRIEPVRKSSDELKANQAFFHFDNGTFVELITPTDPASPVAGPLEKRGEGIHTIAFASLIGLPLNGARSQIQRLKNLLTLAVGYAKGINGIVSVTHGASLFRLST